MTRAVVALGSNLGDRETNLRSAIADIDALDGTRVVAASSMVESHAVKPQGVDETAPDYLNAVVIVDTTISALALLDELNRIEAEHGRVRVERWGDRTLDLDLVTWGDETSSTERLELPHPRAWQRSFVLVPWLQADQDALLPGHGRVDALEASAASADLWHFAAPPLLPGTLPVALRAAL
ncbi:MAG: folK [Microbacteriaceae bacterium]|nr:folK [Microbacteriaceae bacterium]